MPSFHFLSSRLNFLLLTLVVRIQMQSILAPKSTTTLTEATSRLSHTATFTLPAAEPLLATGRRPSVPLSSFSSFSVVRQPRSLASGSHVLPPAAGEQLPRPTWCASSTCRVSVPAARLLFFGFLFCFLQQLVGTSPPRRAHGYGCVWLAHEQKVGRRAGTG